MTQWPSKEAIIPHWDVTLKHQGRSYHLFMESDQYMIDMPKNGTQGLTPEDRVTQPVLMTTGSHHQQYYWLPVAWDIRTDTAHERELFQKYCTKCHGLKGRGGDSTEAIEHAELDPETVQLFWEDQPHKKLQDQIDLQERDVLTSYVERIQFPGRMALFPFAFFIREDRWIPDDFTYLHSPPKPHPSEPYGNYWSDNCDSCHATATISKIDPKNQLSQSYVAELGIACESCHGPGKKHIEKYKNPLDRYAKYLSEDNTQSDDIINPEKLTNKKSTSVCAQCHAELYEKDLGRPKFRPGDHIERYAQILELKPPQLRSPWLKEMHTDEPEVFRDTFWPDGTVRIAGRDYNGLLLTPCYTEGTLACTTCHSMHNSNPNDQLKESAQSDTVCLECHQEKTNNLSAHTHHMEESEGSRCYNCHMPHTTWGLLGAMRAHRIDSPNAETTVTSGRPNACNLCHLDKTLQEVATHLERWYDQTKVTIPTQHQKVAASLIWLLEGDAVQRSIIAWHMGWTPAKEISESAWMPPYLAEVLEDPYSAVRYAVSSSLKKMPDYHMLNYDFIRSPEEQASLALAVKNIWSLQENLGTNPKLLLENGLLDTVKVSEMKRRRDDTPLEISE